MESFESIIPYLTQYSYVGMFGLILACSFGFPFSKSLCALAAGVLVSQGVGNLYVYMVVGILAFMAGDSSYFFIGYLGGEKVRKWRVFSHPKSSVKLREAEAVFKKKGLWAVFAARFIPFFRTLIFLAAGLSRISVTGFLLVDFLSAALFVPPLCLAGYLSSENHEVLVRYVKEVEVLLLVVLVVVAFGFLSARIARRWENGGSGNQGSDF